MIYSELTKRKKEGIKSFALLVDPDKPNKSDLLQTIKLANTSGVDFFFVGGSLLTNGSLEDCIQTIKKNSKLPVVLFPGNGLMINNNADGILLLSVISGRNPEMLIGSHVITAPSLKRSGLEIISTGYMLVDSGRATSATYMSNTTPIPADKADIAVCTAMAGEMLGLKLIFLDGGSGAMQPVSNDMVSMVAQNINIPLIVGGGIKTSKMVQDKLLAGADIIVVGNAIEKEISLIKVIGKTIKEFKKLRP
jgi:putative glycerol-1-phosphate prenyltransferase